MSPDLGPFVLTLAISVGIYGLLKLVMLARAPRSGRLRTAGYLLIWPGLNAARFLNSPPEQAPRRREPFVAILWIVCGLGLLALAGADPFQLSSFARGWLAVAGTLCVFHFGLFLAGSWLCRVAGWNAPALMNAPWLADSLSDFWSRRWNVAFRDAARDLSFRPLRSRVGAGGALLGTFVVSGLLHELAISVPVRQGFGLPTLYFVIQGVWLLGLRRLHLPQTIGRALAWAVVLLPAPLLFHMPFLEGVAIPFAELTSLAVLSAMTTLASVVTAVLQAPAEQWFRVALFMAALAHLCVLCAGVQIPRRLNWDTELPKLSPFNRKLLWVYIVTVGGVVIGLSTLTFVFRENMIRGEPAALGIATFIAIFWTARLIVDGLYFSHRDWPQGRQFVVGHALLVFGFISMAGTYASLLIWHAL